MVIRILTRNISIIIMLVMTIVTIVAIIVVMIRAVPSVFFEELTG